MHSSEFWTMFDTMIKPELGARAETFAAMFAHLDQFDRPVGIIETGCVRRAGNWSGDGGSTLLFDTYAKFHPGSVVYSVDLSEEAVRLCRGLVSANVTVHCGDSVAYLKTLVDRPPANLPSLDLLYLDSYDVDMDFPDPSAVHHLKELVAISPMLNAKTLVAVDDAPLTIRGYNAAGNFSVVGKPSIGGKGKYIADYANQVGALPAFASYQCGWTGFRG